MYSTLQTSCCSKSRAFASERKSSHNALEQGAVRLGNKTIVVNFGRFHWSFVHGGMRPLRDGSVCRMEGRGKVLDFSLAVVLAGWHVHLVISQRSFKGKGLFHHIYIHFHWTFVLDLSRTLVSCNWTADNNLRLYIYWALYPSIILYPQP